MPPAPPPAQLSPRHKNVHLDGGTQCAWRFVGNPHPESMDMSRMNPRSYRFFAVSIRALVTRSSPISNPYLGANSRLVATIASGSNFN